MNPRKVVITAAGRGTRLLPTTKQMPKEMLPLPSRGLNGKLCLKPSLQIIFERLYEFGYRDFCFVVGRGKRAIEDHFTLDISFLSELRAEGKYQPRRELESFYAKIESSSIVFVNQPHPLGFADAIYRAKPLTENEPFLLHAGDDVILSDNLAYMKSLHHLFESKDADCTFFCEKVKDARPYGVAVGDPVEPGVLRVRRVVEKPTKPPSNYAIVAIYLFQPSIHRAIEKATKTYARETTVVDALEYMLDKGSKIFAKILDSKETRIDIGTPRGYIDSLAKSLTYLHETK